MKCEAWQYNTRLALARIFYMQLRFFGLVPVLGRDTYVDGRGRMLIRLLDLVTVGDGTGEAYDIGELVTYLNDGIMIAPTMLLVPEVQWSEVDERSFELSIADHGRTVQGAGVRRRARRSGRLRDHRPLLRGPQGPGQGDAAAAGPRPSPAGRRWAAACCRPRQGGLASRG